MLTVDLIVLENNTRALDLNQKSCLGFARKEKKKGRYVEGRGPNVFFPHWLRCQACHDHMNSRAGERERDRSSKDLGDQLGRVPLPLLVVLSVSIPSIVLLLAHRYARDLEQQEGREGRADKGHGRRRQHPRQTAGEAQSELDGLAGECASCDGSDARPEGDLAKVVREPARRTIVSNP